MKNILNRLINHEILSKEEAKNVLLSLSKGAYNPNQISAFLTVYMMRNITIEELEGFRDAMFELCIRVDLSDYNTIDLCGTGGDGKDTFNISTLAAFITAGTGIKVTKFGNYGISSISGSSNVMEHLGIRFSNDNRYLKQAIEKTGICFLHAPLFHPAMKNVSTIRKELAVKTFFNILGPLVNPAFPNHKIIGVFNLELARIYAYLYQNTTVNFTILHSLDGYDEISLTSPAKIISNHSERMIEATDFGILPVQADQIKGGHTADEAARIFMSIISGKGSEAQNNVVCANAAIAIATVNDIDYKESFEIAKEILISGKALDILKKLQQLSKN